MSTLETAVVVEEPAPAEPSKLRAGVAKAERLIGRLGEFLNPILVKEARQALKSKQFSITFALLLTLVWVWSLLASLWIDPNNFANAPRQSMLVFTGYFVLLAFPLILVVPYGAFRSLAGEIEDGTYELLSITSLSPRQIIAGKMGSTLLQMMLYLSAVSPCLAFTYLLPRVDIVTIGIILLYVTCASALLSIFSLLLATVASQRHWQILLQVGLVLGLCFALWCVCASSVIMIEEGDLGMAAREFVFWFVVGLMLVYAASLFAILFMCAKAMITFASENRSTGIRITLMVPPLITFAALTFGNLQFGFEPESIIAASISLICFWGLTGSMLTAESPFWSARMLRQLPQSLLGRACTAWFQPGPASGYMFVVLNFLALPLTATAIGFINPGEQTNPFSTSNDLGQQIELAWVLWLYLVIFLGINRFLMTRLHHIAAVNVFLGFLVTTLLVLMGIAVPVMLHLAIAWGSSVEYSVLHASNLPFTVVEIVDGRRDNAALEAVKIILAVAAGLVFLLNLRGIWLSVLYEKAVTPKRVAEEELEKARPRQPAEPVKTNPWD